jgi:hypothetical protein
MPIGPYTRQWSGLLILVNSDSEFGISVRNVGPVPSIPFDMVLCPCRPGRLLALLLHANARMLS